MISTPRQSTMMIIAMTIFAVAIMIQPALAGNDIGNCNSCPSDCDVTYISIGGEAYASYTCITYSWRSNSECQYPENPQMCTDKYVIKDDCYSSKYSKVADSKCSGTPTITECARNVGCKAGYKCNPDSTSPAKCDALALGECEKDEDCQIERPTETPFCNRGSCSDTEYNNATAATASSVVLFAVIAALGFAF